MAAAAGEAVVHPSVACPRCVALEGQDWPENATVMYCRRCADYLRRILQCRCWNADKDHQSAAGKASVNAALVRWQATEGLPPPSPDDARRYLTSAAIRGQHGMQLPPPLYEEIYRAWCAGYLLPVSAWFSDEPPPDPDGLWAALGPPPTHAQQVIAAGEAARMEG